MKENKKEYDLVIVGAGPAGSTAAFYIDKLKVLLIDQSDFPRPKACGGGLLNSLDWSDSFKNYQQIKNKLRAEKCNKTVIYWGENEILKRKTNHFFDQVNRAQFDNLLLREALKKDNVDFLKFKLRKILKQKDKKTTGRKKYILSDGKSKLYADFIIGADGAHSQVSKFLGNKKTGKRHQGVCLEYEVTCQKINEGELLISPGYKNEIGYAWIFPTKTGYNIGFGVVNEKKKNLEEELNDFLIWAVSQKIIPKKYLIKQKLGGIIPLKVVKKFYQENILLCGDAMGLVNIPTGEGIYYAMESGKIAGQIISSKTNSLGKSYNKKTRKIRRSVFLFPYTPPPLITVNFFRGVFFIVKLLEKFSLTQKINTLMIQLAIRRRFLDKNSAYYNKKILPF